MVRSADHPVGSWSVKRPIKQSENESEERRSTVSICPAVFPECTNSETPENWQPARQKLLKPKPKPTPQLTPVTIHCPLFLQQHPHQYRISRPIHRGFVGRIIPNIVVIYYKIILKSLEFIGVVQCQ